MGNEFEEVGPELLDLGNLKKEESLCFLRETGSGTSVESLPSKATYKMSPWMFLGLICEAMVLDNIQNRRLVVSLTAPRNRGTRQDYEVSHLLRLMPRDRKVLRLPWQSLHPGSLAAGHLYHWVSVDVSA